MIKKHVLTRRTVVLYGSQLILLLVIVTILGWFKPTPSTTEPITLVFSPGSGGELTILDLSNGMRTEHQIISAGTIASIAEWREKIIFGAQQGIGSKRGNPPQNGLFVLDLKTSLIERVHHRNSLGEVTSLATTDTVLWAVVNRSLSASTDLVSFEKIKADIRDVFAYNSSTVIAIGTDSSIQAFSHNGTDYEQLTVQPTTGAGQHMLTVTGGELFSFTGAKVTKLPLVVTNAGVVQAPRGPAISINRLTSK